MNTPRATAAAASSLNSACRSASVEPGACCGSDSSHPRIVVVGVGNELLSDDGVGVYAVRELQRDPVPGVSAVEIGTAVLHGLDFVEQADRVLVIDAATGGQPPGSIYLFDANVDNTPQSVTSIHAMGLREAAGLLLRGQRLPAFTVLGVEPQKLDYAMSLSAPVQSALPHVVQLARKIVREWQAEGVCHHPGEACPA